ncbi:hypothetical protein [Microbacterium sp. Root280D1]|uniref:hypothetical protein n=1 Tax=Microbacterium sp. Root280D1 TaxID=1736510 RepID=UPI0006F831EE|nr:hypothetical protein [Microbacterium sp. Root280D1]KRD51939.1 hypothetical protein ASE34_08460 [Microbacterium sp. Root280D1]
MSLFESSSKGVRFDTIGASITGTVKSAPRERQQTKYGTQEPDFWPNGDPKMQILVDLQTDQRADANDDGERTLYVASKNMKKAIGEAIRAANASDIAPGGVLTVSYVGNDPASKNPANPAKLYQAQYTAPSSAFVQQTAAAIVQQQTPAFVPSGGPQFVPSTPQPAQQQFNSATQQQAQQPAQPTLAPGDAPWATPQAQATQQHAGGLTSEQVAQQQLRAAGIPEATIVTAINATPQAIATHDNTPF